MNNNYFMALNNLNNKSRNKNQCEKPKTGVQVNNISLNLKNFDEAKENSFKKVTSHSPRLLLQKKNTSSSDNRVTFPKEEPIKDNKNSKFEHKKVKKIINHYTSFSNEILNRTESNNRSKEFSVSRKNKAIIVFENKLKNIDIQKINLLQGCEETSLLKNEKLKNTQDLIKQNQLNKNSSANQSLNKIENTSNKLKNSTIIDENKNNPLPRDGIITNYNTKLGRNKGGNLNPHNTNSLGLKLGGKYINKSLKVSEEIHSNFKISNNAISILKPQLIGQVSESQINKINDQNINYQSLSQTVNPIIESSRADKKISFNTNCCNNLEINVLQVSSTNLADSNIAQPSDKNITKICIPLEESSINNSIHLAKSNERRDSIGTPNNLLKDIISSLAENKNPEKSRNVARNNLNSTKSNLISSDKAQSMQNGSYQKNLTFTKSNSQKKDISGNSKITVSNLQSNKTSNLNKGIPIKTQDTKNYNLVHKTMLGYKATLNINKSLSKSKLADKNSISSVDPKSNNNQLIKQAVNLTYSQNHVQQNNLLKNSVHLEPPLKNINIRSELSNHNF